jgi:lysophospholipase L1-like esterase
MGKLTRALTEKLLGKTWNALRSGIADSVVPGSGGIVMLGDSITHFGRWDLLFPDANMRNFGIGGERSDHLLRRLDPIVHLQPSKIFVLIGTNDLASGYKPDEIAANVDELFRRLRAALPDCERYMQGVMPRQRKYAARIHALNANYKTIATKHAATFIDLFPALDDGSGELQARYTLDRLHLNGPGYVRWREVLAPYIQNAPSR